MNFRDKVRAARPRGPRADDAATGAAPQADAPAWRATPPKGAVPEGITASDLVAMTFDPPKFLVADLLSEGLTVLGGKPKHGKSWASLLLAWAIAAGAELDGRKTLKGDVLYLALEDTRRRLQGRLVKLRDALGWAVPAGLTLQTAWPRADEGGLFAIADWLDQRKDTARLVIVDTLAKFRKPPKGQGSSYAEDYEAVGGFKSLIDHYGVSGLIVHHTRKLRGEDPFDDMSGTLAITGAADSTWVLDTVKKGADARLYLTGRDQPDATVQMTFSPDSGRWLFGAAREGIDVEGRDQGGAADRGATKLDQCKSWLKDFLKVYAYPSAEINEAGVKAGFAPTTITAAKAQLGSKGTGEVCHKNFGGDKTNDWWSGIGPYTGWNRRPVGVRSGCTETPRDRDTEGPEIPD